MIIMDKKSDRSDDKLNVREQKAGVPKEVLVIAQEIKIVQSLACNDVTKRNRQLRKLRKWLQLRAQSSFPFTPEDFMRIWKGLYYNMWMSDKPLVQEELAEQLGGLIHCFGGKVNFSIEFFNAFTKIMCQEWFGIDQWRVDKFLMLMRRMLRHMFVEMKNENWKQDSIMLFNEYMLRSILSDGSKAKGLTMHYLDVFFEELAKVSNGDITSKQVGFFIYPFVKFIVNCEDTKLVSHCKTSIFCHILYQSSQGREYSEKYNAWKEMGFPSASIDDIEQVEASEAEEDGIEESESTVKKNNSLDPRAGNVDVYIPELPFDEDGIIKQLESEMITNDIPSKRRKMLKKLLSVLKTFQEGVFPLGVKRMPKVTLEPVTEVIESKVDELDSLEDEMYSATRMLKKLNKRKRKKLLSSLNVETASEENIDEIIKKAIPAEVIKRKDSWKKVATDEKINEINTSIPKKKRKINQIISDKINVGDDANKKIVKMSKKKLKKLQALDNKAATKRLSKIADFGETTASAVCVSEQSIKENDEPIQFAKSGVESTVGDNTISTELTKDSNKKSHAGKKQKYGTNLTDEWAEPLKEGEVEFFVPSRKIKKIKTNTRLVLNPLSTRNGVKSVDIPSQSKTPIKRVKIVLKHNQEQKPSEYIRQIKSSPTIPYDASKKPTKGLLKPNSMPSPINPFYKKKIGLKFANEN